MAQHPVRHHRILERIQYAAGWQEYIADRALLSRDAAAIRKMTVDTLSVVPVPERSHAFLQQLGSVAEPAMSTRTRLVQ
ncbi:hypothetical protein JQ633_07555 [Bradyrhizobium tropiciagri]|uniref:hypothetical protein n=1 Tax=Bradyrhizobium tropiciagri TaxID=312253 RepID=UPI001BA8D31F|nr:hypothetical protein [Bradyrhizobium tropiciagri]MBR0870207.1 hypothetical protein [Bradyrhizobium tropiciagri]